MLSFVPVFKYNNFLDKFNFMHKSYETFFSKRPIKKSPFKILSKLLYIPQNSVWI